MGRLTTVVVGSARQRALGRSLLASPDGGSIVGEARTVVEALELTASRQPCVLLLGSLQGRSTPPLALSLFRSRSPRTRIILFTPGSISDAAMLAAIESGARGWLDETVAPRVLGKAVRAVARGEAWVPRRLAPQILQRLAAVDAVAPKSVQPFAPRAEAVRPVALPLAQRPGLVARPTSTTCREPGARDSKEYL